MKGYWSVVRMVLRVDDREPCAILQIDRDGGDVVEEKIVVFKNLSVCIRTQQVCRAFRKKNAIVVIVAFRRKAREEFTK